MRNATVQRVDTMIPIGGSHQPSEPHVRHAESEAPPIKEANPAANAEIARSLQSPFGAKRCTGSRDETRHNKQLEPGSDSIRTGTF